VREVADFRFDREDVGQVELLIESEAEKAAEVG
jgi:hypothetical protein